MTRCQDIAKRIVEENENTSRIYTVAHKVGIFLFYPNLWNYFKNNLKIIDLDNSIHSQILLNNNLPMRVLRDC